MTTRMTVQRLVRLIAAGDVDEVRTAVAQNPRLLARAVERDGQGGWTPLHVAVAEQQEKIVRLLVEAGADLSAPTEQGRTPLHVALEQAPDLVGVLRELGAPVDAASAAFLGDLDQLREELARGAHLSDPVTGVDLLAFAAAGGSVTTARLLPEHGADPDRGALHAAAAGAHGAPIAVLRELGAPVDAASAAFLGDLDQLREELARGAHLSDPVTGVDLLAFAAAGGSVTTARLLLEHGADPDRGALHAAAAGAHVALVRTLLDAGADADRRDPETGRTPLHAAVAAGPDGDSAEVVRVLLAAGADVDATTNDGASALDIGRVAAARSRSADAGRATGSDALVELLVAHGATH